MTWMVVRVRGTVHSGAEIVETLRHLHLTRANHATIVPDVPSFVGMLHRVQGYVTWGEVDPETVGLLLRERGRTVAGTPLAEEALGEASRKVAERGLLEVPEVRPLFRLKAPKGGWRSTKRAFSLGGALGYRGRAINDLARRMI